MRYGSVCSGIEAAAVAWGPLGWSPAFFSEIERFPCEVLARRYGSNLPGEPLPGNAPPNLGDMTRFQEWPDAAIDVLVGGTPCQSFSVAGLRKGLADPRGNLALTYLGIVDRYRPTWVVWENVPGVLSSATHDAPDLRPPGIDLEGGDGPRDGEEVVVSDEYDSDETHAFACFLSGLQELGYGFAYRVLDAQFVTVDGFERAVPQRRERVFVVGYLGDWRPAAAVFLEFESLRGNSAPRREAGKRPASTIAGGARSRGGYSHDDVPLTETFGGGPDGGRLSGTVSAKWSKGTGGPAGDEACNLVAHALRAEGFDASEDGTGRGVPIVPICFNAREDPEVTFDRSGPLGASSPQAQAIAFPIDMRNASRDADKLDSQNRQSCGLGSAGDPSPTLTKKFVPGVAHDWAVRRLTPTECERLQGFPDGWTAIARNGKPAADGPRYKALGNSMAVNCMRWIGQRIAAVDALKREVETREAAE